MHARVVSNKTLPFLAIFIGTFFIGTLLPPLCVADTDIRLSGFGSIGAGRVLTKGGTFYDYDTQWSFNTDSIIGGQIDAVNTRGISFTAQAVARGVDAEDSEARYDPSLELMFLAYQLTDDIRIRGGLIRTPFYLYSESIDVGFAYPWVRPPSDVYTSVSQAISNMKGVDATFFHVWGDALLEWRLAYGYHETRVETPAFEYDLDLDPLMGSTIVLDWNNMRFHYSVYRSSSTFSDPNLSFVENYYRTLALTEPFFNVLAENVRNKNVTNHYHVIGFTGEHDTWTLTTEIDYSAEPDKQLSVGIGGAYISLSKQMGKYNPYLFLSYFETSASRYLYRQLDESENIIAPGVNPLLDAIRDGTRIAYDSVDYYNTRTAIGVRYEVNDNVDVKYELEYYSIENYSNPDHRPTDQVMLSFVLDWVF